MAALESFLNFFDGVPERRSIRAAEVGASKEGTPGTAVSGTLWR